ncbi:hypothetical protein BDR06DRAFT_969522 [Suillus hirtellus]|nr:hypothetical protein BDR06DRAFT_969522 [Suillus hirtellus]
MPKTPRYFTESVTVTPKNIPATARDYARASCTKCFMERVDGMQSLEVPIQRDVFSEEKNTYWYGSVVQRASRGCSTNGSALDIQVSALPSYLLNMVVPQRSPSPDPLLSDPNDSGVLAPLDADHSTFHIQLQTRSHKIIIELHGWAPAYNAVSRNVVDIFQNGWIQGIQSRISFKPVQSHVLHRLTSRRLTLYDFNVISIPSKDSRELAKDREAVKLNDITHQRVGTSSAGRVGGGLSQTVVHIAILEAARSLSIMLISESLGRILLKSSEIHASPENLHYDGQTTVELMCQTCAESSMNRQAAAAGYIGLSNERA